MPSGKTIGIIAVVVGLLIAAWLIVRSKKGGSTIAYAPYGEAYSAKPDFAEVERKYPLTPDQRAKLTPQNVKELDQEQVDQIYARLTSGPIPDGAHDGDLFFPKGISGKARISEIVGGLKGAAAGLEVQKLEILGRALWKGKVFYKNDHLLRNRIDHMEFLQEFFPNPAEEAQVREIAVHGAKDQLYFPAKLYCGQSLLDSRKESVIIDYAFTDEIEGYHAIPDKLAGREGLLIRDEIRMVRPGFYLGRAYSDGSFLLNFTVFNDAAARAGTDEFLRTGQVANDCWAGPQAVASAQ